MQSTVFWGCLLLGLSSLSLADDADDSELHLQVGVVASANSSYYQGVGHEQFVLPLVIAEYKQFYVQGTFAGYRLYQGESGQGLAVEIGGTFDGYESGDAGFLLGMADRKSAWEAGLVYWAPVAGGQLTGKLMQDVSDKHGGFSARLDYERPLWMDETQLISWFAGAEYWNRAKSDYYFGVTASEARSDRPLYSAPDSVSLFVGGNFIKQLSPRFSLIVSADYRTASGAVKNSPLVARTDQWSAYSGVFYEF
jgi:outer membrane protein